MSHASHPLPSAASVREQVRARFTHFIKNRPARLALVVFAAIITLVTGLLMLPFSTQAGVSPNFIDALFTATSAVCVTGLVVVETATHWSVFGQVVIVLGIKVGGLGVMTLASLLALVVSRHIGLTQRMLVASETKSDSLGSIGALLKAVIIASTCAEVALFAVLLPRFLFLGRDFADALWNAFFMALSIFNNAGFVSLPEGLETYVGDWFILFPIFIGTIAGAIGFPVVLDIAGKLTRPRRWSLHTKLTLTTYLTLVVIGAVLIGATEWNNPGTLGPLQTHEKLLNTLVLGVDARSSGLAAIDVGQMTHQSWFLQDILMFIGGGTASTAGGIKVTTLAVMILAIVAEARGDRDIEAFRRRIPAGSVRLAVSVVAIGSLLVASSIYVLLAITDFPLDRVAFEVISAFATVGLSTGITPHLPWAGKALLVALMYAGRTGSMTLAAALALRERQRVIRMPEERPAIG